MESCDTFVVMSNLTSSGDVIFGKNSDRPVGEVQEVVKIPSKNYQPNSNVQVSTLFAYIISIFCQVCTYLKVLTNVECIFWSSHGLKRFTLSLANTKFTKDNSEPELENQQIL